MIRALQPRCWGSSHQENEVEQGYCWVPRYGNWCWILSFQINRENYMKLNSKHQSLAQDIKFDVAVSWLIPLFPIFSFSG